MLPLYKLIHRCVKNGWLTLSRRTPLLMSKVVNVIPRRLALRSLVVVVVVVMMMLSDKERQST